MKSLGKEVVRLDHFKRNLLRTLNDESGEEPAHTLLSQTPLPAHSPLPAAEPLSLAGSPARSLAPPPANAKDFFRACRSRMTASSYAELLVCIKRLNAGELSLDSVLEEARLLFGPLGEDLAQQFQLLILSS